MEYVRLKILLITCSDVPRYLVDSGCVKEWHIFKETSLNPFLRSVAKCQTTQADKTLLDYKGFAVLPDSYALNILSVWPYQPQPGM